MGLHARIHLDKLAESKKAGQTLMKTAVFQRQHVAFHETPNDLEEVLKVRAMSRSVAV